MLSLLLIGYTPHTHTPHTHDTHTSHTHSTHTLHTHTPHTHSTHTLHTHTPHTHSTHTWTHTHPHTHGHTCTLQIGLLGIQIIWTSSATNALTKARTERAAMAETDTYFQDMLETLIAITTQDLSKIERIKFETLITIHLHQRDIFHTMVGSH